MKWSRDVPALAGWYWMRSVNHAVAPEVVLFADSGGDEQPIMLRTYSRNRLRASALREAWDLEWYGPIQPPEEPPRA